ncbi:MAG: PHP domain-containing protein [Clostridia bacterium]|nr:PHP domain-containing protein [Clostridia bacterium]
MIDIHMHSVYSDGSKTVKEILQMCEDKKLEYVSITDHNNCEAYYDKDLINNNIFKGKIIKGCELNAEFKNRAIEILGYNINTDVIMEWRQKYYSTEKLNQNNKIIQEKFLNILDNKGIIYNKEDIRPLKDYKEYIERPIWEEVMKHPENKEIVGEEYFKPSLGVFFRKEVTNPNSDYFLNRVSTFPNVNEVVDIIHKAGGKAFVTHPFEYRYEDTIKFLDELRQEKELDGIECFHPSSENEGKTNILIDYARRNNLYISGGSDYHGKNKPDIQIGTGRGSLSIPKELIEEWI